MANSSMKTLAGARLMVPLGRSPGLEADDRMNSESVRDVLVKGRTQQAEFRSQVENSKAEIFCVLKSGFFLLST